MNHLQNSKTQIPLKNNSKKNFDWKKSGFQKVFDETIKEVCELIQKENEQTFGEKEIRELIRIKFWAHLQFKNTPEENYPTSKQLNSKLQGFFRILNTQEKKKEKLVEYQYLIPTTSKPFTLSQNTIKPKQKQERTQQDNEQLENLPLKKRIQPNDWNRNEIDPLLSQNTIRPLKSRSELENQWTEGIDEKENQRTEGIDEKENQWTEGIDEKLNLVFEIEIKKENENNFDLLKIPIESVQPLLIAFKIRKEQLTKLKKIKVEKEYSSQLEENENWDFIEYKNQDVLNWKKTESGTWKEKNLGLEIPEYLIPGLKNRFARSLNE